MGASLNLHTWCIHWNSVLMSHCGHYIEIEWQEMTDMHIAFVSSAHTYALSSYLTPLTKYKFEDKNIKYFMMATSEHKTKQGAFFERGPCLIVQVICP